MRYIMKHERTRGAKGRKGSAAAKQRDLHKTSPPLLYSALPFMNYEIISNVASRFAVAH